METVKVCPKCGGNKKVKKRSYNKTRDPYDSIFFTKMVPQAVVPYCKPDRVNCVDAGKCDIPNCEQSLRFKLNLSWILWKEKH
jgi:hypothetical protein